jgi:glycine dehydrogenase subunit 2
MHLNLHKTFSTPHGGGGPGSGPVAIKKILEPFLPTPVIVTKSDGTLSFDYNRPQSVGRVRAFYGNFGMFVRALAYIQANGPDGLRQTTEDAVLNANYIRKGLEGTSTICRTRRPRCTRWSSATNSKQRRASVRWTSPNGLIDYGFHPYTTAFPLIVPGALMIEPTESESKEEMDLFVEAMKSIAEEVEEDPQTVLDAPHSTRVSRLDETSRGQKAGPALEAKRLTIWNVDR